jgi:hypothetical protein
MEAETGNRAARAGANELPCMRSALLIQDESQGALPNGDLKIEKAGICSRPSAFSVCWSRGPGPFYGEDTSLSEAEPTPESIPQTIFPHKWG